MSPLLLDRESPQQRIADGEIDGDLFLWSHDRVRMTDVCVPSESYRNSSSIPSSEVSRLQ